MRPISGAMDNQAHNNPSTWYGTTILSVRKGGKVVIAGDGQVLIIWCVVDYRRRRRPVHPIAQAPGLRPGQAQGPPGQKAHLARRCAVFHPQRVCCRARQTIVGVQEAHHGIARLLLCIGLHRRHAVSLGQLPEDHGTRQDQAQSQQHHGQLHQGEPPHAVFHGLSPFWSSSTAAFRDRVNVSYRCTT